MARPANSVRRAGPRRLLADLAGPGLVIVIGASTGGPLALRELLQALPPDFPAAVMIIQHMPENMTSVLASQLNRQTGFPVKEAEPGELVRPGCFLVAPGGYHLLVLPDRRVRLTRGVPGDPYCPSIDSTMQSAAEAFGSLVHGALLTGMGEDGVNGLALIRNAGGHTYAQSAETCTVAGMPQRAMERGVVDSVASPAQIGYLLGRRLAGRLSPLPAG